MSSLAKNKSIVVVSNSFRLPSPILGAITVILIGFLGFNMAATADVIFDRKAGFKANAVSMKAIAAAIGGGDYRSVINQATTISTWAEKIPNYFPEGSSSGNTNARAEIWANFDDFRSLSKANQMAANKLVTAAKSGDPGAMMEGLKNLGGSCKACHKLYKD